MLQIIKKMLQKCYKFFRKCSMKFEAIFSRASNRDPFKRETIRMKSLLGEMSDYIVISGKDILRGSEK